MAKIFGLTCAFLLPQLHFTLFSKLLLTNDMLHISCWHSMVATYNYPNKYNCIDKCSGWKIMIVDTHSMRVISSAIGMYDIMERKVTIVESLEKKRAPFPNMDAIYFLEPSSMSVAMLLADYASQSTPLYGKNVFLYFLGRLPDALFSQIKSCRPLVKALRGLMEVNIDFLVKEERAFTLDMRNQFTSLYVRRNNTPIELSIAEKLVTVCGTLNEYPHIRYRESSALSTSLANVFHLKMEEFIQMNSAWWYHGGPTNGQNVSQRERATLLILDRSDDCLSPLMHEYSYQCLVHDLLKVEDDKITYMEDVPAEGGGLRKQPKDVLLNEKDDVWTELRSKHVAEVSKVLSIRIREITNSAPGSVLNKKSDGSNLSMKDMAAAVKALPEYKEVLAKLGLHLNLSLECLDIFTKRQLKDLAELEQTMATGQDDDLRKQKLSDVMDAMEARLSKIESPEDRLRLMLIATIALGGLRNQDRRRLVGCAELPESGPKVIEALETFGIPLVNDDEKNRPLKPYHPGAIAEDDPDSDFQGSRYVPVLKSILKSICNRELSFDMYPSVVPMPDEVASPSTSKSGSRNKKVTGVAGSARTKGSTTTSRWASSNTTASAFGTKKGSSAPLNLSGARILVFVIGGASYSELRVCREIMEMEGREVVLGSTAFISPNEFISDLTKLAEERHH